MKVLYCSVAFILMFFSEEAFSQRASDLSGFFPEFSGCERVLEPIKRNEKGYEQTAVYQRGSQQERSNPNYFGCGSITFRFEPSARKATRANPSILDFPFRQPFKLKKFDAYSYSPWCGNDMWLGSTQVYFDEDKVLTVSAYVGSHAILEYAQNADYAMLKKTMNKLAKRQN